MEITVTLNEGASMIEPALDFLLQTLPWNLTTAKKAVKA